MGPVETSIDLTVKKNVKKPLNFTIVRKIIEVQSSSKIISKKKTLVILD